MIKTVLTSIVMGLVPITVFSQNTIPGYTINSSTEASTVSTEYGKVAGYIENGIYNYKGIPYAEAERFEEPHAPATWNGNGVPQWPAYTTGKKATMMFDKDCTVKYGFDQALIKIATKKR